MSHDSILSRNEHPLPELYRRLADTGLIARLLELARDEDLGPMRIDLTGSAIDDDRRVEIELVARDAGVLAGLAAVPDLITVFDAQVAFCAHADDGDTFKAGDRLARFEGPLSDLVRIERTVLNLTSRLSGIATRTASFVRAIGDAPARLYDTRKTTPGLRMLEKYAVRCGGGHCHRLGLYDAVMFKDNHIAGIAPDRLADHARSLATAARTAGMTAGIVPEFVCFEVDSIAQLEALLTVQPGIVDIVLLDNMPTETLREAVALRDRLRPALLLEASGGVSLDTIRAIAATGVDRISVGGLTHQAVSLDLGFDAIP